MECHELANLFPAMSEKEIDELASDIAQHGLREPIMLLDGKIIDGRHRYHACLKANVEPQYSQYAGSNPTAYVVSLNLRRRHLDESQRAVIAAKLATMKRGARRDIAPIAAMSDSDAARLLNVSERSVERAKAVQRKAIPELIAAVEEGKVTVSAAHEFSKQPKDKQKQKLASAPTMADAVRSDRGKRAIDVEALGFVGDPLPKKRPPKRSKPDQELYHACRSYQAIEDLPSELTEPKVFWRCVEVHRLDDVMRNLKEAMRLLEALIEVAMQTRH